MTRDDTEHWVFAYGSLLWNPGFDAAETVAARLEGYARSFCLRSTEYRGTIDAPGLVLGLDADETACCTGLALRVAAEDWPTVHAYLCARELNTEAYQEMTVPLALADGRHVRAITYVMRREHWQYAGGLPVDEQAEIIARAAGQRGPNAEYLFNTASHLAEMGVSDAVMEHLTDRVRALLEQRSTQGAER